MRLERSTTRQRKIFRHLAAVQILALLGTIILAGPAPAFKTFRAFGGAVHEGITREAIGGEISAEAFKIIDDACTSQDNLASYRFTDPTHHFDNNRLEGSRSYVETKFGVAVEAAGDADTNPDHRVSALEAFGLMIHTLQDLYAHSNYIELNLRSGTAAGDIRPIDWNSPPDGLRTGYFFYSNAAYNEVTMPRGTCVRKMHAEYPDTYFATIAEFNALRGDWSSYEGALAYTCGPYDVLHFEMDKDNAGEHEGAVVDPRSGRTLFDIARGVAVAETRRQWQQLLQAIRDKYGETRAPKIIAALTGKPQPETPGEPLKVGLGADKSEVKAGQKVSVAATATGGVPPYKYGWLVDDLPEGSSDASLSVPISAGPHTIHVDVTDSATPAHAGSANITVTGIAPKPLTLNLVPDQLEIELDHRMGLTADVSGGVAPYTYAWSFNGSVVSNVTGNSIVWAPQTGGTAPGRYPFSVTVTDSADPPVSATAEVTITLKPPPLEPLTVSLGANTASMDPGQSLNVTATVTGGLAPYHYDWTFNGSAASNVTGAALQWNTDKSTTSGDYAYSVTVTDSADPPNSEAASGSVNVKALPVEPLKVSLGANTASMDPGEALNATVTVTGGLEPYHYQWTFNGSAASNVTGAALQWNTTKSTASGDYAYSVTVTDSADPPNSETASGSIHLNPIQLEPLKVTLGADHSSIEPGDKVTVTATATGGLEPYHYDWTFNGNAAPNVTGKAIYWTSTRTTAPGDYAFSVVVTDSANPSNTETAAGTINVKSSSNPLKVTLGADRSQLSPGQKVSLTASVSGGTAPYKYVWTFNGAVATNVTSPSIVWTPKEDATLGDYPFTVEVTDSSDPPYTTTAGATITLVPASGTSEPPPPAVQLDPWVGLWRGTSQNTQPDDEGNYHTNPSVVQVQPYGNGYALIVDGDRLGFPENYQISRQGDTMQISYQGPYSAADQSQISFSIQGTLQGDTLTGRFQETYYIDPPINFDYSFTLQRAGQ